MSRRRKSPVKAEPVESQMCDVHLRLSILQRVPFFAHLPVDDITQINQQFHEYGYAAGETIYFSGDRAGHLCVVASGQVKLLRHTLAGQDVLVDVLSPGEFFGALSSLEDTTYTETAQAHTAICVLRIAAEEFRSLLARYSSVALAVLDITSRRLHDAHEMLRQLSAYAVEKRIAYVLLKLGDKLGEAGEEGLLIQMPLTRDDIAQMTGTTSETASRIMSQFHKDGLIHSGRQWVAIADRDRLASLAEPADS
jgi:CRP/FNR family transcriptional regulator, nitrogen oxide reductase regulator